LTMVKTLPFILFFFLFACADGGSPEKIDEVAVQGIYSGCLSQDGKFALIGSIHHGGSYWQTEKIERLYDWNHKTGEKTGILFCGISGDQKFAATSDARQIALWNTQNGQAVWLWQSPADIRAMAINQQGNIALLGMNNYEAAVFDIQNGGVLRRLRHEGVVQAVAISADNQMAVTGGDDSLVRVWDLKSGKMLFEERLDNQIKAVAISENGQFIFASSYLGKSFVWDMQSKKVVSEIIKSSGHYITARFSSAADTLLTGTASGRVQLWKLPSGKELKRWEATPINPWSALKTQVLDVAFAGNYYRAIGANGRLYTFK
jgi:WD40 repeat protein